ncbi:T9SS type A sorting domain-containing protein [Ancylomarina salipaludis]|uniref:T9SS type A sorting domain-containing protein n=1 Tax=Ancylomarina salipaludis TaxID=2501299 RepID=A0A4V1MZZ4_9BACT|nr:M4 family metallopeptidase [Ancylomarina salipaludis]RXQ92207.1 T9SS type A sorting domain-containing protein [Ancylomarina salipaludis]
MKKCFTLIFIFAFICHSTYAQEIEKQKLDQNGHPTFIKFNTKGKTKAATQAETKAVLSGLFNMTTNDAYKSLRSENDRNGYSHERFQQYHKGIKVENGVYIVHSRNKQIESLNGNYKLVEEINIRPSLTENDAREKAKAFVNAEEYMSTDNKDFYTAPELVIVAYDYGKDPKAVHEMVLAYKIDIYATKPLSRAFIYVDAHTGEIVHTNARLHRANETGSAVTRYSGTKPINTESYSTYYRLRDYTRGNGIVTYNCNQGTSYTSAVDFTDNDNNWSQAEYDNSAKDNGALDAHWAGMMTYDYFKNTFNRNSFDNNGALIKTYVHFDVNYDNAYWNGSVFTFGDGSSFDILTSLDVFGHEFGHAVCSYTADLNYQNEEGALNEAFSDIWGCAIEYKYAPNKDTWAMGEDLGSALRSISDPKSKGLPDTYQGTNWAPLSSSPSRYNDYGGVHTNNGPFCHWFYLITEGGSGTNDNGDSYNVTAIGIEKAEQITFRIESQYMTSSSNYADARTFAIQAAQDLYGAGSQEEISVTNAMYAIGVGTPYGEINDTYCSSKGSDFSYEWISEVAIGTYTNSSGATGYSDFTDKTINLEAGATVDLTLTPGYASTSYNEYWKIWIDYNKDFTFSADELVYDAGAVNSGVVTGSMTLDASASGTTRMRISMKYNGAQTTCETFGYGEVEDYTVTFGEPSDDTEAPSAPANLASSNIADTSCTLNWTASTDNVAVKDYQVYQDGNLIATTTGTTTNVTGLTESTTYRFYVTATDAKGNISAASNSLDVTTTTASTNNLTLTITFDRYPEETSWALKDGNGSTVASGGTYNSQADESTLVIPIDDLTDGCYEFTISDAYGDGICCAYGNGSYKLENSTGTILASGGSFGSSEVTSFCLPSTTYGITATNSNMNTIVTEPAVNIYPNPASSFIKVQVTNAKTNGKLKIYSTTGSLIKVVKMDDNESRINISELPTGLYLISVETKKEIITKKFIKK